MTAALRTILTGRGLVESPRWHEGRLYFSDWSAGEVIAVDDAGQAEVVASVQSLPLCTAWHPDGRLLVVSSPDGTVLARQPDGSLVTHADLGQPGWNDIAVDGRGHLYVNRCGFDPMSGEPFRPGSVHLVTPGGTVSEVAGDIDFPNGMAVTADDRTLIVADSYRGRLLAFDIAPDGTLSGRRIWADLGEAAPDGLCVDAENAVWYADVPNRRCVRVAEGGEVLRTADADRGCFACALGGPDGATLYITAAEWHGMSEFPPVTPGSGRILALDVEVPAAGWV
ncbi:SMP-30/gluconolactonase/LRE family protein [Nocardia sp. alder85J]|uniref:SMP-30/gluconolactonase/LRE family protein n=1 Tax=Nocardia sp. alder85J TaxID=2862949 RepID=UPI001CD4D9AB|nr:SMP-30/gluconolactonase/LRE family protein [Nocardia sp. alder85J]MCX4098443.1 SMP-30/gluconolactonase/LRE family protein [Nocardia sp. alder85J]